MPPDAEDAVMQLRQCNCCSRRANYPRVAGNIATFLQFLWAGISIWITTTKAIILEFISGRSVDSIPFTNCLDPLPLGER